MDSIVLRVPELKRLAATLVRDKIDFVQILLTGDNGDGLPPSAAFTGLRADAPEELVDYDEVEGVPEEEACFVED
jgi:hypothetical protein